MLSKQLLMLVVVCLLMLSSAIYFFAPVLSSRKVSEEPRPERSISKLGVDEIQLTAQQAKEVSPGTVGLGSFGLEKEAIGIIDFNQDATVQVLSPYQGRIQDVYVQAGDDVTKDKVLYTVQIPDLATSSSGLIAAAGALRVANEVLKRAQSLNQTESIAFKEFQQNQADQQVADANYRAARKTLLLFGLTEKDIDDMEAKRKVETVMPVRSPFAGRITSRAGATGQLVQPGSSPAPVALANMQSLWMIASIPESDIAEFKLGQSVAVKVSAYPGQTFSGRVSHIGEAADSNTHRIAVRAEVVDRRHLLKPQMQASFTFTLAAPITGISIPANALARDSDGSMYAWGTQDGLRFKRRKVRTGLSQNGMVQILEGLVSGEKIAMDKALFLSNLLLISTD